ncbi:PP2C family protein-serine/threonine phosphatase [Streptomyces sp. NPDC050504]|uniref:PP2C family protein-serine/threonine phosphatase n=1 Tax=Streptomyces sp. NPDC050504 TaxID=3365618 RepID=UPI00378FA830
MPVLPLPGAAVEDPSRRSVPQPDRRKTPAPAELVLMAAAVLLAATGVVLGLLLRHPVTFLHVVSAVALLPVLPVLSAAGTRAAALAGGVALVGVCILAWGRPSLLCAAAATTLAAAALVRFVVGRGRRQEARIAELQTLARAVQAAVLPRPPASVDGTLLDARYLAATPGATVGGDICGAEHTLYGTRLFIGDVSGKGLDAVAAAAEVLHIWRELAHHEPLLAGIALRLDTAVGRIHPGDGFVTALLLNVDREGRVELLSCGHPPPVLVGAAGIGWVPGLDPAPPLGLLDLGGDHCPTVRLRPEPGDWLLLCTDGVAECRNGTGDFYPLVDRLAALTAPEKPDETGRAHAGPEFDGLLDALESDLAHHRGDAPGDDAIMMLVRPGAL